MILKKPYAFLIKHFRLIHFILALATIYLTFKTNKIVLFFNAYIKGGYRLTESNVASNYVTLLMYLAVILIIGVAITIYLLLKVKDKPTKFYIYLILYYIILFSLLTLSYNALQSLELTTIDAKIVRVYRDLSLILSLPQYFFVVFATFRGIGFDIKKFNFNKDMSALQIDAKDNEEFEFVINSPIFKIKRVFRRTLRESKYFILENTFIMICLSVLLAGIIGTSIYMNRASYSQVYKENQSFNLNNYKMRVLDSVITPLDYNGNILLKDKSYLVVLLNIQNNTTSQKTLNMDNFRLLIDNEIIYPTLSKNEYFIDLGTPYSNQKIAKQSNTTYAIIYELTDEQIKDQYTLRIQESLDFRNEEIVANYKEITLKPSVVNIINEEITVNLNEELDLSSSSLSNSKLLVSSYEIAKSYKYNYNFCINDECQVSTSFVDATYQTEVEKTLLVLGYTLTLDESTPYKANIRNNIYFFNHFLKIKYTYNDKEYIITPINKTPNTMTDKIILEANSNVKDASNITLVLTIRNKQYNIVLK